MVASLGAAAGADGGDAGQALSQFDIGYVLLPAPVDQALARQLDGAAGLIPLTTAPAYDLWQVAGTVARARVISADGTVVPVPSGPVGVSTDVPAGTSGTLVLAEAAGGWSATLNGRPLAKLTQPVDGWAQGFVLPAGGGHLIVTRDSWPGTSASPAGHRRAGRLRARSAGHQIGAPAPGRGRRPPSQVQTGSPGRPGGRADLARPQYRR